MNDLGTRGLRQQRSKFRTLFGTRGVLSRYGALPHYRRGLGCSSFNGRATSKTWNGPYVRGKRLAERSLGNAYVYAVTGSGMVSLNEITSSRSECSFGRLGACVDSALIVSTNGTQLSCLVVAPRSIRGFALPFVLLTLAAVGAIAAGIIPKGAAEIIDAASLERRAHDTLLLDAGVERGILALLAPTIR